MPYVRTIAIEFNHCDPAGIVFYPRYFEMTNSVCENFFAEVAGRSYARIMADGNGVPTVRLTSAFRAPSRLGDRVEFSLRVVAVGRSSLDVAIAATCNGEPRMEVDKRLVWLGKDHRAAPWPEDIRTALEAAREAG